MLSDFLTLVVKFFGTMYCTGKPFKLVVTQTTKYNERPFVRKNFGNITTFFHIVY